MLCARGSQVWVSASLAGCGLGLGKAIGASRRCGVFSFRVQAPAGEDRKELTSVKWGPTHIPPCMLAFVSYPWSLRCFPVSTVCKHLTVGCRANGSPWPVRDRSWRTCRVSHSWCT